MAVVGVCAVAAAAWWALAETTIAVPAAHAVRCCTSVNASGSINGHEQGSRRQRFLVLLALAHL